jgi:hypothetical protein
MSRARMSPARMSRARMSWAPERPVTRGAFRPLSHNGHNSLIESSQKE